LITYPDYAAWAEEDSMEGGLSSDEEERMKERINSIESAIDKLEQSFEAIARGDRTTSCSITYLTSGYDDDGYHLSCYDPDAETINGHTEVEIDVSFPPLPVDEIAEPGVQHRLFKKRMFKLPFYVSKEAFIFAVQPVVDRYLGRSRISRFEFDSFTLSDFETEDRDEFSKRLTSQFKYSFHFPCIYIYTCQKEKGKEEVMYVGQPINWLTRHGKGHSASSKLLHPDYKNGKHRVYICNLSFNGKPWTDLSEDDIPWIDMTEKSPSFLERVLDYVEAFLIKKGYQQNQCKFNTQGTENYHNVRKEVLEKVRVVADRTIPLFGGTLFCLQDFEY
jgi:hypothetical protein